MKPPTRQDLRKLLARYQQADHRRSLFELLITVVPLGALWGAALFCTSRGWWWGVLLAVPAAAFLVRLFMIQHDCGHHAFFRGSAATPHVGVPVAGRETRSIFRRGREALQLVVGVHRLYDAIESGVADLADGSLKSRIAELRAMKEQAEAEAERAAALGAPIAVITPAKLRAFSAAARRRLRGPAGGYRRDHLRALAQRVEVAEGEVRIIGSRTRLLRTLSAIGGEGSAPGGVPTQVPNWR